MTPKSGCGMPSIWRSRRSEPEHGIDVERARKHLAQNAGAGAGNAKIGHETRRVPVSNAGHEHTVKIGENSLHRLRLLRRLSRQGVTNIAGSNLRQNGIAAYIGQVIGDPVYDLVSVTAKIFGPHIA